MASPATAPIVIHAGRLLADASQAPLAKQSVRIENGRIHSIAAGFVDPPAGARLIDLKEKFVLPGLIDCHVHLMSEMGPNYLLGLVRDSDPKVGFNAAQFAKRTVEAGFTTVRDVGAIGNPDVIFALRDAIAEGKVVGPRVLAVGAILSPTGGHGQIYEFRADVCACVHSSAGRCDGADDCRRAVRDQVARGADAIKFVATGGVLSDIKAGIDQQFTNDEIKAIIDTAHGLGRRVAAHAHGATGVNAALRAGVDSIEHGSFVDDESIRLFLEKRAYHVPTIIAGITVLELAQKSSNQLSAAQAEKAIAVGKRIQEALGRTYAAGVNIAFGTDMGVGPHGQNAREFKFMVDAGMKPADAIKAATINAAALLDRTGEIGTITTGKSADIIAVDGDPLTNVTELERVSFVMARGNVVKA
jgi:imidazolonepropionase-like amidohydrolase